MGHFENQIEERREAEQQLLEDSFVKIAGIVLGQRTAERLSDERIITKGAIDEILKYYHYKPVEIPENVTGSMEQLDYCMRPYGLMSRTVELEEGWYKDAFGPVLAFTKEGGKPVALLPGTISGYRYSDPVTGQSIRLNRKNAAQFGREAICFYRPLPQKKLGIPDLMLYMKNCISLSDIVLIVASTLAVSVVGLLMPRLTRMLTGPVLSSGRKDMVVLPVCFSTQMRYFMSGKVIREGL